MVMAVPLLNNKHLHKKKNNSSQGSIVELLCLNKNSIHPLNLVETYGKLKQTLKLATKLILRGNGELHNNSAIYLS
jgi:hypothetical protein